MPFALAQVVDAGDLGVNPFDIAQAIEQIEVGMDELTADGTTVVTLGGDHTIAYISNRFTKNTDRSRSFILTPTWTRGTPTLARL
jgi:arginase family enzyme